MALAFPPARALFHTLLTLGTLSYGAQMRTSPLHLLHRAEQAASRVFHDGALGFVTPRQLAVLITVAENEGGNLTGVIQRTGMDRSTTSELVGRMARMGLLHKRRSRQDTRAFVLKLTDEGRKLLKDAEPVARNIDAALLQTLPQARREPFLEALRAIVARLEE
jgi:DNA-binding MarR family transcriptional regulator